LLEIRWYGESVNALLPAAQIGGDLLRGRLAQLAGVSGPTAAASIAADLALSLLSLVVFVAIGAVLLGQRGQSGMAIATLAGSASLAGAGLAAWWLLRQAGAADGWLWRLMQRLRDPGWLKLAGHATALRDSLRVITADWRGPMTSTAWQLAAWIVGAGEIWLAARFLGHPLSVADAVLLESLLQAIRNAAFPVPGALGVQDGGLMILAPLVGLGPETGLAISLLKRARELVLGVPGLALLYLRSWRYRATSG
jgi:putative membrane protein